MTTAKSTIKVFHFESTGKKSVVRLMQSNPVAQAIGLKFFRRYDYSVESYQAIARVFATVPLPKIHGQDFELLLDHDCDSLDVVVAEVKALYHIPAAKKTNIERTIVACFGEIARVVTGDASCLKSQYALALVARLHRLSDACASIKLVAGGGPTRHLHLV